ncbi:hypothetical protein PoB_004674900 [Plakobranchus ocellatus]|uniref:Uncharacterized protein n=1 Tax=Plakobranchus ocellatus TaxID=259542 RepID=A0AAV4BMX8_9GAST|nr:hypothetical protein PoB_004674900 [Plakobranchus ocellatus]
MHFSDNIDSSVIPTSYKPKVIDVFTVENGNLEEKSDTRPGVRMVLLLEAKSNMLEELFTSENYDWIMTISQKDSRVKMAAARNTLESLWRPPKAVWNLPSGRQKYFGVCLAAAGLTLSTRKRLYPKGG